MQVLFRTISKEEEDALRGRYAGTQAERSSAAGAREKKAADKGARSRLLDRTPLSGSALSCTLAEKPPHQLSNKGAMIALLMTQ